MRVPKRLSSETITVSSTAIPLTTIPGVADSAEISIEADTIRFWKDGSTPTASVGHRAYVDDVIPLYTKSELRDFLAIRVTTDATLRVTYYIGYDR